MDARRCAKMAPTVRRHPRGLTVIVIVIAAVAILVGLRASACRPLDLPQVASAAVPILEPSDVVPVFIIAPREAAQKDAGDVTVAGVRITATAYCPCRKCCGRWADAPMSTRRTASGAHLARLIATDAKFCAADTRYYPFGTILHVPGYGPAIVLDRGGAIKGPHRIDLFFATHQAALEWGRQTVTAILQQEPLR